MEKEFEMFFSKSDFNRGSQCPKWLWMKANRIDEFDETYLNASLLEQGHEVGDLAKGLFGPYTEVEQTFRFREMAERTDRLLSGPAGTVVCEATFTWDGCVCMGDIVRVSGPKAVELYEVKSSTKLKPYHRSDIAFQAWVIRSAGYEITKAGIIHLDGDYVLDGELDIRKMFKIEDMTDLIDDDEHGFGPNAIERSVDALRDYMLQQAEPFCEIGKQCNSPHPCPFQGHCWAGLNDEVTRLAGHGRARSVEAVKSGETFRSLLDAGKLKGIAQAQAKAECGEGDTVDAEAVRKFLDANIGFPLYFLDFETVQPAVPIYQGCKPFAQVPTQASLHWLDEPGGPLYHAEYLAPSTGDPRRGVAEALAELIPEGACVTAYNKSFECTRLKELAEAFPDLASRLSGIRDCIVDLMVPFQKGMVYLKEMGGSYSIKHVLPALFPDCPELDYASLDGVHNGSEAMAAFAALAEMDPEEEAAVRESLLRYCELDTLAMVKVYEALVGFAA